MDMVDLEVCKVQEMKPRKMRFTKGWETETILYLQVLLFFFLKAPRIRETVLPAAMLVGICRGS